MQDMESLLQLVVLDILWFIYNTSSGKLASKVQHHESVIKVCLWSFFQIHGTPN